jgi:DNA replication protein DnaC
MTRPVTVTDRTGLAQALRQLKLSGMLATLDARLTQAAAGDLGHLDFLQVLCEDEITRRASVSLAKRIRRARFEEQATLEGFDFAAAPKLPAAQIRDLAALRWLHAGESVILYGPGVIRRLNFLAACSPRSGRCCDRCDDVRWLRAAGSSRAG